MKSQILFLSFSFLFSTKVSANVNLTEGSYETSAQHQIGSSVKSNFTISRFYSSRSTFRGYLGLGWCSSLEWSLDPQTKQLLKCDLLTENTAVPTDNISQLVFKVTEQNINYYFTREGLLFAVQTHQQALFKIFRNSLGFINKIQNESEAFELRYDQRLGLLTSIQDLKNQVKFFYQSVLLTKVVENAQTWDYQYDESSNLIKAESPFESEEMSYDNDSDRLLGIKSKGCFEKFEYRTYDKSEWVFESASLEKTCAKAPPEKKTQMMVYDKIDSSHVKLRQISSYEEKGLK